MSGAKTTPRKMRSDMKVHELIALLQAEKQDAEVRFSETYVSRKFPDERHSCGPEEGSQILGVTSESSNYDHADVWEDHVILQGEILVDVPGPHYAPFEDASGAQPMTKEVPGTKGSAKILDFKNGGQAARLEHEHRAITFVREPKVKPKPFEISKAHKLKYKQVIQGLSEAKKKNVGLLIIAAPWVLGDDYEELVTNLNLMAKANLKLCIGTLDTEEPNDIFPKFEK